MWPERARFFTIRLTAAAPPMIDFPIHIWLRVFEYLAPDDIFSLPLVCRQWRTLLLGEDYVWDRVYYRICGKTLMDYAIELPLSQALGFLSLRPLGYARAAAFYGKFCHFRQALDRYDALALNVARFVAAFTTDTDYIAVATLYLKYLATLGDFSRVALAQNLLHCQNYRLGFEYMSRLTGTGDPTLATVPHFAEYENFWFRLSHFDKCSHRLVLARMDKFGAIARALHQRVMSDVASGSGRGFDYVERGNKRPQLCFDDDWAAVQFVVKVIGITLSTLGTGGDSGTSRYMASHYLEDFSVLRLYANEVMGHPMVVSAVVLKALSDFTAQFDIVVGDGRGLDVTLTKHFMHVNNHFVLIDTKTAAGNYNVKVFTRRQVIERLRRSHSIHTANQILSFLSPVDLGFLMRYFLSLELSGYGQLVSSFLETQEDHGGAMARWFPTSLLGISRDDFKLVQFGYGCVQASGLPPPPLAVAATFGHLNNFIHYSALCDIVQKRPDRIAALRLVEPEAITMASICQGLDLGTQDSSLVGAFVLHTRLHMYGVVVGVVSRGASHFCKVYTQFGTLETFRPESVQMVTDSAKVTAFVRHSAMDVLGLIFCKRWRGDKFEVYNYATARQLVIATG